MVARAVTIIAFTAGTALYAVTPWPLTTLALSARYTLAATVGAFL